MSDRARARERLGVPHLPLRFLSEGIEGTGFLENVSRAGAFVRTSELPRPGAVVVLQFRSRGDALVDIRGEVRWTTQGLAGEDVEPGFGVVLQEPSREFRAFLRWVLDQATDPEKREGEPAD